MKTVKVINRSGRTYNGCKHGSSRDISEDNLDKYLRVGFVVFGADKAPVANFTKKQAMEYLDAEGIEYDKKAKAADLVDLAVASGLVEESEEESEEEESDIDTTDLDLLDDGQDDGNEDESIEDLLGDESEEEESAE